MSSRFHRSKQQRAERSAFTGHGNINLVPLVDILTSIVFFSLLTYEGSAMAALTSFDLSLPPVVINSPTPPANLTEKDVVNLLLTVKVDNDSVVVQHSEAGGFKQVIRGLEKPSLDTLQGVMMAIRGQYPQNRDVLVVPSDNVSYDNVVHVLERIKLARLPNIALGSRARNVAVAGAGGR